LKVDLIWENFKPKVIREATRVTTRARIGGLDRRPDASPASGDFDTMKKSFEELKSKYSVIDVEGQSLKKEVKDLKGLVETLNSTSGKFGF
jgi:archaellum component FlaC